MTTEQSISKQHSSSPSLLKRFWRLYTDGFSNMSRLGRTLWIVIIAKLVVMFLILRLVLMPDILGKQSQESNIDKATIVRSNLIPAEKSN